MLSPEGSDALKEDLKTSLLKEYDEALVKKSQEEVKIDTRAVTLLKKLERELSKPSPTKYYSSRFNQKKSQVSCELMYGVYVGDNEMLESEFDKWHTKQVKREEALKEVENKVRMEGGEGREGKRERERERERERACKGGRGRVTVD